MNIVIGVICGGFTSEIQISNKSGRVIFETLLDSDYQVFLIQVSKENWTVEDKDGNSYPLNKDDFSFVIEKQKVVFDGIVNMIHGAPGENGQLAGMLELLNIPQTSCDSYSSGLTYNKRDCLAIAKTFGIPTATSFYLDKEDTIDINSIINKVGLPCFVKANRAGSSFGVYKVNHPDELATSIQNAFKEDSQLIIETALEGREVTIGVMKWDDEIRVFPITEIISENDFFDYEAKYKGKSKEITPAQIPEEWSERVRKMAVKIYSKMKLNGITRSEFIFQDGIPHLLEVNTIPGMTKQSIIPQQAAVDGVTLNQLMKKCISQMLENAKKENE